MPGFARKREGGASHGREEDQIPAAYPPTSPGVEYGLLSSLLLWVVFSLLMLSFPHGLQHSPLSPSLCPSLPLPVDPPSLPVNTPPPWDPPSIPGTLPSPGAAEMAIKTRPVIRPMSQMSQQQSLVVSSQKISTDLSDLSCSNRRHNHITAASLHSCRVFC